MRRIIFVALTAALFISSTRCDEEIVMVDPAFRFASYYQENMVLQMEPHQAVIWGYGTVGATVNVSLIQDVYSTKVVVGPNKIGIWEVTLSSHPAGGPFTIQAVEDNHGMLSWILLKNVLFGDVWICSGQSNMEFTLSLVSDAAEEIARASRYTNIRLMTPSKVESSSPLFDLESIQQSWSLPSEASLSNPKPFTHFSAVCWYFGRYLHESLGTPIGFVAPTWGGTPIETWSSPKALRKCSLDKTKPKSAVKDGKVVPSDYPVNNSVLWNAMIHPLLNMTIKGSIWYQGEANAKYHNEQYACSFPAMISDWRNSWYEGTGGQTHSLFPFGFVQLSTVEGVPDLGTYQRIRWHQTANYGYVPNPKMPNTFMAVAFDLGDPTSPYGSIHPRDKQDVAARLLLGALNVAYGQKVEFQGPLPQSAERTGDGLIVLTYPNSQHLLVAEQRNFEGHSVDGVFAWFKALPKPAVSGFRRSFLIPKICCNVTSCNYKKPAPSSDWLWAPITSHTHRTVTVSAKSCTAMGGEAEMIRYGWAISPCVFKKCSVYSDQGLPGPPFYLRVVDL